MYKVYFTKQKPLLQRGAFLLAFLMISACTLFNYRANAQSSSEGIRPYCDTLTQKEARLIERSLPQEISVEFDKYRKWIKNSIKIITTRLPNIPPQMRRKFTGQIIVKFDNGTICSFRAKIRQHGDWKDHIKFESGQFVSSLDVQLLQGHINGVVRFKLLIDSTRNGVDEIIFSNLMRALGFLSPRTYFVNGSFAGVKHRMIFQEKQTKELIEAHKFREGPLLEGDESLFWSKREGQAGLTGRGNISLSRLVNENWALKGETSLAIAQAAQSKLSFVYAESKNRLMADLERSRYSSLNTDILSGGLLHIREQLEAFDALLWAASGGHGLSLHNRKFYYDAYYDAYRPIYYDGNISLFKEPDPGRITVPVKRGSTTANALISKLKTKDLQRELARYGVEGADQKLNEVLDVLTRRLEIAGDSDVWAPGGASITSMSEYMDTIDFGDDPIWFAVLGVVGEVAQLCRPGAADCREVPLTHEEVGKLLAREYVYQGEPVIFFESRATIDQEILEEEFVGRAGHFTYRRTAGAKVRATEGKFEVLFSSEDDWLAIERGTLGDMQIEARSANLPSPSGGEVKQRFNQRLLTGCLTFVDVKFEGARIRVSGAGCEDAVNFIRTQGTLREIRVDSAFADAIDVDYSDLRVSEMVVRSAGNDCVDLSAGNYELLFVKAVGCDDKAVSVGEGSKVIISTLESRSAHMGLAAKDSSIVHVGELSVHDSRHCIQIYRKKQEYSGAYLTYNKALCNGSDIIADPGSYVGMDRSEFVD